MQTKRLQKNVAIIWIFLFCITQLSGCSFLGRKFSHPDGAPNVNVDVSKIPDAVPQAEPRSKYGNNDYVIEGRRYHVLKTAYGYNKIGYASWYGTKFHGRLTSTHERYNLFSMTAASPELPLPTYVQVTNLCNGKKIIVKVNDRGPFRCNRILDLSYVAAKKLGYSGTGTAKVRVVAIDPRTWNQPQKCLHVKCTHRAPGIYLQVGAYKKIASAKCEARKVAAIINSAPTKIAHCGNLYHVQIGPIASAEQCQHIKQLLAKHGIQHVISVRS